MDLLGVDSVTVGFDVKVQDAEYLPTGAQAVNDSVHGDATFITGDTNSQDASSTLSLGIPQLKLEILPENSNGVNIAGGKVHPGDTITYSLRATSTDPVSQLVVRFRFANSDQLLPVPGSVTGGGQVTDITNGVGLKSIQWTLSSTDSSLLSSGVLSRTRGAIQVVAPDAGNKSNTVNFLLTSH